MANRGRPGANPYSSFTTSLPCDLEQMTSLSFSLIIFNEVDVQRLRQELFRDSLRWNVKEHLAGCQAGKITQWMFTVTTPLTDAQPAHHLGTPGVFAAFCLPLPPSPFNTISVQSTQETQIQVLRRARLTLVPRSPAPDAHLNAHSPPTTRKTHGLGVPGEGHGCSPPPCHLASKTLSKSCSR